MIARSSVFVLLLLAIATLAAAQETPMEIDVSTACQGDEFILTVSFINYDPDVDSIVVRRVTTAPDLLPAQLLTPEPISISFMEDVHLELPDPGVGPGDLGIYEIEMFWVGGTSYYVWTAHRSCVEAPFLMRGYLTDVTDFLPCTGQEMLECDVVSLLYGDMNLHIGTAELLEIYGWPITLYGRDQCSVTVHRIESLGTGQTCEDVVPAADVTWGTMKAQYR